MNASEIAVLLGVLGFFLSCVNLWRAILSSNETRSLAFAQKKQEALTLLIEGEVAYLSARRQLWEVRDDAYEAGANELADVAVEFIGDYERSIARLAEIRTELEKKATPQMRHQDQLQFVETTINSIKQITDPPKIYAELSSFVDQAKRNIILRKKINANSRP